jgi:2-dehydropantoate 2-reductase
MAQSPAEPQRATIAVVGLGAIGGIVAGCLRDADRHDVVACVRTPVTRLVLERAEGTVELPLRALTDPAEASPVDWVLLCTKGHQTAAAAPWLTRLCGPATCVAVLQNGIGHAARVAPFVNGPAVIPTLVYFNGERLGPDRVRLRRVTQQELAVPEGVEGRTFAELLDGTSLRLLLSSDFATLAWRKLLINAVANPVTALTLQRQAVFRRADIHALCVAILDEAVAVGRADGAQLAADETAQTMATLLTYPPEAGTSMYFDRLAGRTLEVEPLTGAIVAAGERLSIATPLNRALLALLRAVSDAAAS